MLRSALPAAVALGLCACPAAVPTQPARPSAATPLSERFAIDGSWDPADFATVHVNTVEVRAELGAGALVRTTTLRWAARNDDRDLYLALEWDNDAPTSCDPPSMATDPFDALYVAFDASGDGTFASGEDARRLIMTRYGSVHGDLHASGAGLADDAVWDGVGRLTHSAGRYHAELLVPLAPDAAGEDGALGVASRFNVVLHEGLTLTPFGGRAGALSGGTNLAPGTGTTAWERLPYTTPGAYAQPVLPAGLAGLIVFISDHENPDGELYTFEPATGAVARVTHGTGLYLDGCSLSHDRRHIAFHGAPTRADYEGYEIYTVAIDGTDLTTVTRNGILDAHPAWSPDDGELVYASFRSGGAASLVRSTRAGTELADLTPPGANDNDPEWLPDGRIVFKTDRFGSPGSPQVKIAVMNADGTAVRQLTRTAGTSDHDPTATSTVAVFERFPRGTDYATDPSSTYAPWDIVEASVDGSGERTLVGDGWTNWLPVRDPSGRYLAYLKSKSGYTDVRLMTADGRDLGRLVPDQTRIRYIDWK